MLADAERYPDWVVGAAHVVHADPDFPAPGARFRHRVGVGPLGVSDYTEVLAVDPPRRIVLKGKARPLGTATIELTVRELAGGTAVRMDEAPGDRLSALVGGNPLADVGLRLRNAAALARLKRLAEDRPIDTPRRRRDVAGQRVLITGGSSGIGLAVAERLAAAGARIVLLARAEEGLELAQRRVEAAAGVAAERAAEADPERAAAVRGVAGEDTAQGSAAEIDERGAEIDPSGSTAEVHTVTADVRDRDAVDAAVGRAAERLGGLDVLVTAAVGAAYGPFLDTDPEDFDATVATVLGGTANCIRAALPRLEAARGAVVALGSTAGRLPTPGLAAYAAAKHGLVGLLDSLRVELREAGSPTTVSLVNPGPVDTPLWDHLESQTGLLPPVPPDRYSADAIAAAVVAVIRRPREETTVGGSASLQVRLYALLRGPTTAGLTALARLAEAGEDKVATAGSLHAGRGEGSVDGGHGGRRGLKIRGMEARDALERRLRR